MVETISDMDIELEQKDNKIQILEYKKSIPDSTAIEKTNRLDLNKIPSTEKKDRFLNRIKKQSAITKTLEIKINEIEYFTFLMTFSLKRFLSIFF